MPNLCPEVRSKLPTVSYTYNVGSRGLLLKLVGYLARVRPDTSTRLCRPPTCFPSDVLEIRGADSTPSSSPVKTEDIHRVWKGWHEKKLLRGTDQATAALIIAGSEPRCRRQTKGIAVIPRGWLSFRAQFGRRCLVPSEDFERRRDG